MYLSQLLLVRSNKWIKFTLKISIYKSLQQLVQSSEMLKILIFTHTPYIDFTLVFIHELVVRARQLTSVVAQLVRALHWNRRTAGSIPARGLIVAFIATAASG